MTDSNANNKRIAKNTLLLYLRMFFMMLVSLYTSRVVLNALGIDDFGIYNIVGGCVAMFSIVSGSLSAAISRFITYELGRENAERLMRVFSSAIIVQVALALLIFILAETVGLWFINVKINIHPDRMFAANWVFQFAILTFVINLVSIPYNAAIIAHEKMAAFAYISILEAVGKLSVAYFLFLFSVDKLIIYAALMCVVAVVIRFVYTIYCKIQFQECRYKLLFDKRLLKQMFSFAGWNFIGASSTVLRDQGGNIVLNLFYGPAVNAARALAYQINGAIQGFVNSFTTALNPQITKSYAADNHGYMMTLLFQGARFSFYMLLLLALPLILNTQYVLILWLKDVPEHTVLFVQLFIVFAMSESISNPLVTAMLATGKIRNYQIVVGGLQMMNLPVSYFLLKFGCFPEITVIVAIFFSQCCLIARLYMLREIINISVGLFLKKVYINVLLVAIISFFPLYLISKGMDVTFISFIISCLITVLWGGLVIYFMGFNSDERRFVCEKIVLFKSRLLKK